MLEPLVGLVCHVVLQQHCLVSLGVLVSRQVVVGVPMAWGGTIRDLDSWGPR